MRVLKPEVAQDRKEKILNWVVYNYVCTGRPVSSELITKEGAFNVSSATVRNILKELEQDGFLFQPHTSGGRIPTDKGYRAYVNNVMRMQRLAIEEKQRLEREYERKIEQLDGFLKQTSKMLSDMSQCAGFVMTADTETDTLRHIELLNLGGNNVLSIIFSHSGLIKNTAFSLCAPIEQNLLRQLSLIIGKRLYGHTIPDCVNILRNEFLPSERNIAVSDLYKKLYDYFVSVAKADDSLYMDGLSRIFSNYNDVSPDDVRDLARLLEEKERFSQLLRSRMRSATSNAKAVEHKGNKHIVEVTIGTENNIREFKNFSLISTSYKLNDKAVGIIGILGYKRMEYPRMISLVDTVSSMMEEMLAEWDKPDFDY